MRAGKLDRRLIIERPSFKTNEFGEELPAWKTVATVWAQQRPERGAERLQGGQVVGTVPLTFHIRYLPGFSPTDRVIYEGRTYSVTSVRELGRRVVHEFDAVAEI